MGRKINGKKHRGVRDPEIQAARRLERIGNKINLPPKCDQEVSKRMLEFIDLKNKSKQMRKIKKVKKQNKEQKLLSTADFRTEEGNVHGALRPVKHSEVLTQQPNEKNNEFMYRLGESCKMSLREAYFEDQFGVLVKRDPQTSVVTDIIKDRYEADNIIRKAEELKTRKKKKEKTILTKHQKKKAKLHAKMEIKAEKEPIRDFSDFKDEVKFGEVVHRPPDITALPRMKVKANSGVKPGQRDLLLKAMLNGSGDHQKVQLDSNINSSDVSIARKKMLEEERLRVVKLYRQMKRK